MKQYENLFKETTMRNHEILAGQLYNFYCAAVGGKAFNNSPLPHWFEFRHDPSKQKQSDAWVAMGNEAVRLIELRQMSGTPECGE